MCRTLNIIGAYKRVVIILKFYPIVMGHYSFALLPGAVKAYEIAISKQSECGD